MAPYVLQVVAQGLPAPGLLLRNLNKVTIIGICSKYGHQRDATCDVVTKGLLGSHLRFGARQSLKITARLARSCKEASAPQSSSSKYFYNPNNPYNSIFFSIIRI